MSKKIAVEVSGYMRTFLKCVPSWNNFLYPNSEEFSFDFFVHTYEYHGYSLGFVQKEVYDDEIVDISKIKNILNPIELVIEPNMTDLNSRDNRIKLMFRKIHYCHKIVLEHEKKNDFKYYGYIRIRPDLIISDKLIIPEINEKTGIFNSFVWDDHIDHSKLCDQMFICDSIAMESCANVFKDWDLFEEKHPETILFNQSITKKINIKHQNFNISIHR